MSASVETKYVKLKTQTRKVNTENFGLQCQCLKVNWILNVSTQVWSCMKLHMNLNIKNIYHINMHVKLVAKNIFSFECLWSFWVPWRLRHICLWFFCICLSLFFMPFSKVFGLYVILDIYKRDGTWGQRKSGMTWNGRPARKYTADIVVVWWCILMCQPQCAPFYFSLCFHISVFCNSLYSFHLLYLIVVILHLFLVLCLTFQQEMSETSK